MCSPVISLLRLVEAHGEAMGLLLSAEFSYKVSFRVEKLEQEEGQRIWSGPEKPTAAALETLATAVTLLQKAHWAVVNRCRVEGIPWEAVLMSEVDRDYLQKFGCYLSAESDVDVVEAYNARTAASGN